MTDDIYKNIAGKKYWRSLDQVAETPEFRKFVENEFPEAVDETADGLSRRRFMTLMGASLALAGLAGCRRPVEKILPYVSQPEEIIPGIPLTYATTMPFGTNAYGLLVTTHEGRPTGIHGNPLHPTTLGSSNSLMHAEILSLYDPDRSRTVLNDSRKKSWDDFVAYWKSLRDELVKKNGRGLAVLSGGFSSPTLYRLKNRFSTEFPEAKWAVYEPVSDENILDGIMAATGKRLQPVYDFSKARVILSLDSDFLMTETDNLRNARGFGDGRHVESPSDSMNRLYTVEASYSLTGTMADHRLPVQCSRIGQFTVALASEMKSQGLELPVTTSNSSHLFDKAWIKIVAHDLITNAGKSLLIAGRRQPAAVHALTVAINEALGNVGNTVKYIEPQDTVLPHRDGLKSLIDDINAGQVETLIIADSNPTYNAPADLKFSDVIKKCKQVIHIGQHADETSTESSWHIPQAHFLESWGDARSIDGTASLIQPMIEPLFGGKGMSEFLNLIASGEDRSGYDILRETWVEKWGALGFEKRWRKALHDGVIPKTESASVNMSVSNADIEALIEEQIAGSAKPPTLEALFAVSNSIYDGRYANNGWLQELPDPITKLSWDNAAVLSPHTAEEIGVENEDVLTINTNGQSIELPVWIVPGHADNSITLELGYGHKKAGKIGSDVGANVYMLRTMDSYDLATSIKVTPAGRKHELANTQDHGSMEGRHLVREANLEEYRKHPAFAGEMVETPPLKSLFTEHKYDEGYQWGMTIDLNKCIGCGACTTSCQSENNIMIVGKEQVQKGREMHWIRLDRYFTGDENSPAGIVHQPVACHHCEMAPCEQVCPVAATVHDSEGLNVMVYNRCIGTRYCSNNCPFKARRFNFFHYSGNLAETIKMANNPDVTVRSRGVMEKCTYCIQRINAAKQKAKKEGREVADGEIVTACQQACPTKAIQFGNVRDTKSKVAEKKKSDRRYDMLAELNLRPRTSYLAKLRNPNPALLS